MGNADRPLDHLKQDLASGAAWLEAPQFFDPTRRGDSAALADSLLQYMSGAQNKMAESLEVQKRLRRELAHVQESARKTQAAQQERIRSLEAEACALRRALEEERGRVRNVLSGSSGVELAHAPPDEHLDQPLVLRSQQGEFLGVTDKCGQALTLSGFLRLVETGAKPGKRVVASCWEARSGCWNLTLCLSGGAAPKRCYSFETIALRTPNGNKVTLLSAVSVDGEAVPTGFVVQMFRHLRESFQEE